MRRARTTLPLPGDADIVLAEVIASVRRDGWLNPEERKVRRAVYIHLDWHVWRRRDDTCPLCCNRKAPWSS